MDKSLPFDITTTHRYFSASCYNKTWELMDKKDRSPEETEEMIHTCHASFWHWLHREDRSEKTLSIGYWQLSRVYVISGNAELARQYGLKSLENGKISGLPFYQGYAFEAIARAESLAGNKEQMEQYLLAARQSAELVINEEDRKVLLDDLETIYSSSGNL